MFPLGTATFPLSLNLEGRGLIFEHRFEAAFSVVANQNLGIIFAPIWSNQKESWNWGGLRVWGRGTGGKEMTSLFGWDSQHYKWPGATQSHHPE